MFQLLRTAFVASCLVAFALASGCGRVAEDDAAVAAGAGGAAGSDAIRPHAGAANNGGSGEAASATGDAGAGGAAGLAGSADGGAAGRGAAGDSGWSAAGTAGAFPAAGAAGAFADCLESEILCDGRCVPSTSACNGVCVDRLNDAANCGVCGRACQDSEVCVRGSCQCEAGKTSHNGQCIDTQSDPTNCGTVKHACALNEVCDKGKCECRPGMTSCDGTCYDTGITALRCGACDMRCPTGGVCTYGVCEAPSSDWPTFGYDLAHSGENTAETGKPPLSFAWEDTQVRIHVPNSPVLSGGQLYVVPIAGYGPYVFNVSDGSPLWHLDLGLGIHHGLPAVFSNVLYLVDTKGSRLLARDTDGAVRWNAPLPNSAGNFGFPLRLGDTVFVSSGTDGGLYGFDASDGTQKFVQLMEPSNHSWSVAEFSGHIYSFVAGHFRAHDPNTGAIQSQIDLSWTASEPTHIVPVFSANRAFVITPPSLVAIDPAANAVAWTVSDAYTGTPAVSGNAVYGISAGNLVVRDAASGSLQWSFAGASPLSYPPVIANSYVYVAGDQDLYAIDISTHQAVDHQPIGGWLIVGSHRLIVAPKDKPVTAFVLSK